MAKFRIETPNKLFNGVRQGVAFEKGVGETDSKLLRDVLVNNFGYKDVTPVAEKKAEEKASDVKPKTQAKKKKSSAK